MGTVYYSDSLLSDAHKITPFFELKIPQTRLEDILIDNPSQRQGTARVMHYDADPAPEKELSGSPYPRFADNIRTISLEDHPSDRENNAYPDLEFSLTSKICKLTKNAFAESLDDSDYICARRIVQDKKDLSELSAADANVLLRMIARYEKEETLAAVAEKDF